MRIFKFTFNDLRENTYLLADNQGNCIVVDPGCYYKEEEIQLVEFISSERLVPLAIVNTHAHLDHILGVHFLKEKYQIPFYLHPQEEQVLRAVKVLAPSWGVHNYKEVMPDYWIDTSNILSFGDLELETRLVPGHSPGSIALIHHGSKSVISGDALFYESIGRSDLPGGNHSVLLNSIRKQLFILPDEYKVYPGHGWETQIGHEKMHNPFLGPGI